MVLIVADRVQETCTSPGTGTVTLLGAVTQFQTFSATVGNTNTTFYVIADQSGSNWEVGIGTYTSVGNTLARTTVLASSNAGSLVNFATGTQNVWGDLPAGKAVYKDASGNAIGLGTPAAFVATNVTGLPMTTGVTGVLAGANGGTGVNNGSNTFTYAGNVSYVGAFTQTWTRSANTSLTLPTSGTLLCSVTAPTNNPVTGTPSSTTYLRGDGTWSTPSTGATSTYIRTSFTATAAQTTFTVAYTVGYLEVYVNGVLLNGADVTATSGTAFSITACAAGDIVESIAYNISSVGAFVSSVSATAPVTSSGGATPTIAMAVATTSVDGYLSATDWTTFNGKYSVGGALGTPSTGTLTNCTGLPIATGVSGLGTSVATFLATPSSANLLATMSDETGTGSLVFATSPTLVTPVIGTATGASLTNTNGFCSTSTYTPTFSDGIVVDYTTGIGRFSVGSADGFIWYNGATVASTALLGMDTTGNMFKTLSAPTATTATATLTIAQLLTGCLSATPTATATYTLPTGTLIDTTISTYCAIGQGFEWSILNNAAFVITVAAGTGHTVSGGMGVAAGSAAAPTNARFRTRKTAANTYVTYRIA